MKLRNVFLLFIISLSLPSTAQEFHGKVVDASKNAISWANVILKSMPDSAYLIGTTTDENGRFKLSKAGLSYHKAIIQITCIGYNSLLLDAKEDMGTITLNEKQFTLGEVVVREKRPAFKMHGGTISADVQHTLLSQIGNSMQLLGHLPFISESNNALSVFGRGTPVIYIDNRRLENNEELVQLSSSEIKNVKLLLNPGVSYDTSVKSVIKITTIRKQEGWSLDLLSRTNLKHNLNQSLYAKLNYRHKNWDFFSSLGLGYNNSRSRLENTINFQGLTNNHIEQSLIYSLKNRTYNGNIGGNYSDVKDNCFGLKYDFNNMPFSKTRTFGTVDYLENGSSMPPLDLNMLNSNDRQSNHLNIYYAKKFSENNDLQLNMDYYQGRSTSDNRTQKTDEVDVVYDNGSEYKLYIAKMELSNHFWGGEINYGAEMSYTDNKQEYNVLDGGVSAEMISNQDHSKQFLWSLFVSKNISINDLSVDLGGRFESANYRYYNMGKLQDQQSRVYNRFFPSFQVDYNPNDKISLSLSYTNSVIRPTYGQLSNGITYIDSYTYQGGNSKLKSSYDDKLSLLFSWKDLLIDLSHTWHRDPIIPISKKMDDHSAVLFTIENLPDYREWAIDISYNPTLGLWSPKFEAGVYKQSFTYREQKYNHPYFTYEWDNLIRICKQLNLSFDLWGTSSGHSYLNYFKPTFRCDMSIHALFMKNRLSVSMKLTDLFKTDREWWSREVNQIYMSKKSYRDAYGLMIQLRYSLNPFRSKYKGKSGNGEVNRL